MSFLSAPFGFMAFGRLVVPLPGGRSESNSIAPYTARAGWSFYRDGRITDDGDFGFGAQAWFAGGSADVGDGYEIRATKTSGTTPFGDPVGVWLTLSVGRAWWMSSSQAYMAKMCDLLVEIRRVGTGAVATSGTFSIWVMQDA